MTKLTRLIDLPGVARIEEALADPGRAMVKAFDDLPKWIEETSLRLFGITEADTEFQVRPEDCVPGILTGGYQILRPEADRRRDEWERYFAFLDEDAEEQDDELDAAFWAMIGLDVTDENGEWLYSVDVFGRQIVCIIKGLLPRARLSLTGDDPLIAPEGEDAALDAERWGARLAEEARRFKRPG